MDAQAIKSQLQKALSKKGFSDFDARENQVEMWSQDGECFLVTIQKGKFALFNADTFDQKYFDTLDQLSSSL